MKFRERFLNGLTDFDEIFDLTDEWSFSDETCTLREFLGLTAEEEDIWISDSDEALEVYMEKEKNRKIFFTDLDGTLLNDQKEISAQNRKAINELLAQGHIFVISTGRALVSAIKQAEHLKLSGHGCYIISFNGGQIYDTESKQLIYQKSVPFDLVRYVFDEAHKFDISVQTYSSRDILVEKDNFDVQVYVNIQQLPYRIVENIVSALSNEPAKILILDFKHPERIKEFREYITPLVAGRLDVFTSHEALLELVPPEVNKGNAVRFLCNHLGIPLSHSVSAGDAENDLTMIQAAQVGAVMCNGEDLLKEHADYITNADNNHDGVSEIIKQFVLNHQSH